MDLQHGCRSEYGPLELRIQTTASLNGFAVFLEDRRQEPPAIFEHPEQSTLESAKESAVLQADEYLSSRNEECRYGADWRCS